MTKFCTNCGKELTENPAICLNCGIILENNNQTNIPTNNRETNSKKKKGLPTWAIVLIVLGSVLIVPIMMITILGVVTYNIFEETYSEITSIEETVVLEGTVGDTLTTENFKIKLQDVQMYNRINSEDNYDYIPYNGKEYLVFFLDVQNISYYEKYISDLDFTGYVDGYEVEVEFLFDNIEGISDLDAELLPNKKTKGYVAFEVDTTWKNFELHYSDWFSEYELIFTIENSEALDAEEYNTNEQNSNITGA